MQDDSYFMQELKREFERLSADEAAKFSDKDSIRADIHCHDKNSDVPDERLARMLRWPETWVSTQEVIACMKRNGAHPATVTNHNNARSCFEMMDKGMDMIPGAEFTCTMPDFDIKLHVLTYGFTPSEEDALKKRRRNLYRFLEYANDRDLVTVLAHPLFFYNNGPLPPVRYLERLMLMFDNIEGWNGQRDAWQNLLVTLYATSLDEQRIHEISKKEQLSAHAFCRRPFQKRLTGGSDCHMALFAGTSGVRFHVPNLAEKSRTTPVSRLILESFRSGDFAWFGAFTTEMKLTAALLDYFCQAVRHIEDPGLFRLLLHKGESSEKLAAMAILNGVMELRRHKYTSKFLQTFRNALHGKRPGFILRRTTGADFKPFLTHLDTIASAQQKGPDALVNGLERTIPELLSGLFKLLSGKVEKNLAGKTWSEVDIKKGFGGFIDQLECPAYVRSLVSSKTAEEGSSRRPSGMDLLDGLPFPALAAVFLGAAVFSSAKAMHGNRRMLDEVAARIGKLAHPTRVLWLTDTLFDKNGVSTSLNLLLDEIRKHDLPIDLVTVSDEKKSSDHLIVLPSLMSVSSSLYKGQPIRFADYTAIHRLISEKRYGRVVCSTEGPMGLVALYLKSAFSLPAYFYMHTDWIDFAKRTLSFNKQAKDRLRRLLRAYYQQFDGIFVLNKEHEEFLGSDGMGIAPDRIHRTAHWAKPVFRPQPVAKYRLFPSAGADTPVILFAGRLSEEKGVSELASIFRSIRRAVPQCIVTVAGDGPMREQLQRDIPDAFFTGWISEDVLSKMYAAADVLLFPSRFDTFGNVVLEAHACGLPVVAYNTKGPRDIIVHDKTGFLVESKQEMADAAAKLLLDTRKRRNFRQNALARAEAFNADDIVEEMIQVFGLSLPKLSDASVESASVSAQSH